jgi:hypothetical protein
LFPLAIPASLLRSRRLRHRAQACCSLLVTWHISSGFISARCALSLLRDAPLTYDAHTVGHAYTAGDRMSRLVTGLYSIGNMATKQPDASSYRYSFAGDMYTRCPAAMTLRLESQRSADETATAFPAPSGNLSRPSPQLTKRSCNLTKRQNIRSIPRLDPSIQGVHDMTLSYQVQCQ